MLKTAQEIAHEVAYKQRVFEELQKEAGIREIGKAVAGKAKDAGKYVGSKLRNAAVKTKDVVKDQAKKSKDAVKEMTPRQKGMLGVAGGLSAAAGIGGTAAAMSGNKKEKK